MIVVFLFCCGLHPHNDGGVCNLTAAAAAATEPLLLLQNHSKLTHHLSLPNLKKTGPAGGVSGVEYYENSAGGSASVDCPNGKKLVAATCSSNNNRGSAAAAVKDNNGNKCTKSSPSDTTVYNACTKLQCSGQAADTISAVAICA